MPSSTLMGLAHGWEVAHPLSLPDYFGNSFFHFPPRVFFFRFLSSVFKSMCVTESLNWPVMDWGDLISEWTPQATCEMLALSCNTEYQHWCAPWNKKVKRQNSRVSLCVLERGAKTIEMSVYLDKRETEGTRQRRMRVSTSLQFSSDPEPYSCFTLRGSARMQRAPERAPLFRCTLGPHWSGWGDRNFGNSIVTRTTNKKARFRAVLSTFAFHTKNSSGNVASDWKS